MMTLERRGEVGGGVGFAFGCYLGEGHGGNLLGRLKTTDMFQAIDEQSTSLFQLVPEALDLILIPPAGLLFPLPDHPIIREALLPHATLVLGGRRYKLGHIPILTGVYRWGHALMGWASSTMGGHTAIGSTAHVGRSGRVDGDGTGLLGFQRLGDGRRFGLWLFAGAG